MKFLFFLLVSVQAMAGFSENYLKESLTSEIDSSSLDACLENFLLARATEQICFEAVKSLTQRPLSPNNREILYSLLTKLQGSPDVRAKLYASLKVGLQHTHPELSTSFTSKPTPKKTVNLELKAWKKSMQRKISLSQMHLLINGKAVALNSNWTPPEGIFQWALVTDNFDPVIRLSSFTQFAVETMKEMKPLSELKEESTPIAAAVPILPKLEPEKKNNNWIWPVVAIVGIGVANSLQNKKVSVSMPSFR